MSHARISPTALYTGAVWNIHHRSFPELQLPQGQLLYKALQPAMLASKLAGGPTLVDFLLARHDLIDAQVDAFLLRQGGQGVVIEIAAGLSPRGMRFTKRHGNKVQYIEADLPHMAANKAGRLSGHLAQHPNHRVVAIDAFAEQGPHSLTHLFGTLPAGQPVCVVTEGLLNYFSKQQVEKLFANLAKQFKNRAGSVYVTDIHLQLQNQGPLAQGFKTLLGLFVQGRVHLHYESPAELLQAVQAAGLLGQLLKPSDFAAQFESCRATGANFASILVAQAQSNS